jgi:mannan endo-1,4-beta-mannosidase
MYNRLTNFHQINNLIWCWSTPEPDWYPGNIRVDIIGYDSYPGNYNYDCQSSIYNTEAKITKNRKMIMMTENGSLPDFTICLASGVKWGFFMIWRDYYNYASSSQQIQNVYTSKVVKTLANA